MNILQISKNFIVYFCVQVFILTPVFALDFDSTVNDSSRVQYIKPQKVEQGVKTSTPVIQKTEQITMPDVPALPKKVNSSTVAPVNNSYTGKQPKKDAFTPCTNVNNSDIVIDKTVKKQEIKTVKKQENKPAQKVSKQNVPKKTVKTYYRTAKLSKGTQFRVSSCVKIGDYMYYNQKATFVTLRRFSTPYYTIPENTQFTAKIIDAHRPQMTCNGGLIALQFVYADINGLRYPIKAHIVKVKTKDVYFGNLKGRHTYFKSVGKKAKWGQKICKKWTGTASKLASKGPCIILAPFPYIGGVLLAGASTISSPVTALFAKGESISFPAGTIFTIELDEDVAVRY